MVVEQRDHLAFFSWQFAAGLVKRRPAREIIRLAAAIEWPSRLIGRPVVGVVIGGDALRTEVVSLKVDELAADLRAGEIEKVSGRLDFRR